MFKRRSPQGVVGSFAHLDAMLDAVRAAKEAGVEVSNVFSPVPIPEAVELVSRSSSPVRFATLVGGLSGCVGGFALAIGTSMIWDIIVGGKPVTNHVPFVVVAFELTVLLGALATLAALFFLAKLPYRGFPGPAYRGENSLDRFGLWLAGDGRKIEEAKELLARSGGEGIQVIGPRRKQGAA